MCGQSPITVLLRTPVTEMIIFNQGKYRLFISSWRIPGSPSSFFEQTSRWAICSNKGLELPRIRCELYHLSSELGSCDCNMNSINGKQREEANYPYLIFDREPSRPKRNFFVFCYQFIPIVLPSVTYTSSLLKQGLMTGLNSKISSLKPWAYLLEKYPFIAVPCSRLG